jgi:hypothetical protein
MNCEQWLKAFLSGGSRPSKEIEEVAELQGFGWSSVRSAKAAIGTIKSVKIGYIFHWKDSTVADKKTADDKLDLAINKIDEFTRLSQAPRMLTEDGPMPKPDPNERDSDGFLKYMPPGGGDGSVQVMQVLTKIKQMVAQGTPGEQIVSHIFEWAYPACKMPETILVKMLRNAGVHVASRNIDG